MDNLFKQVNTNEKRRKFDIKTKKNQTIQSLLEVEHFLCQTKKAMNSIKLYKILK